MTAHGNLRHESAAMLFGTASAVLSADRQYRYQLTRTWGESGHHAVWIMLNPSTADARADDSTIRRCTGFSRAWGMSGLVVVNLFALRATDPRALDRHPDPVGPANDWFISEATGRGSLVVAAWGAQPAAAGRVAAVAQDLAGADVRCLGLTRRGTPRHPLYVRGDQQLVPFAVPEPGTPRSADLEREVG